MDRDISILFCRRFREHGATSLDLLHIFAHPVESYLERRGGVRLGHGELLDSMVHDGLWDIYNDFHMGMTAELVAEKYEIGREQQDEFAARSHQKAEAATKAGRFDEEKLTVSIPQRKADPIAFTTDETIRDGLTADGLAKMRPAFKQDGGTVTAANASAINDGAAALVVMSADRAKALSVKYAVWGCSLAISCSY